MARRLGVLAALFVPLVVLFQNFSGQAAFGISIDPTRKINHVQDNFFGANLLVWFYPDCDPSGSDRAGRPCRAAADIPDLQKTDLGKNIKSLGLRKLRFPGGNFSQNFDWKTSRIAVPGLVIGGGDSPTEDYDPAKFLNFREFCELTKKHDLRPVYVVDIESALVRSGTDGKLYNISDAAAFRRALARSAQHAADWVRTAKSMGCPGIQWEIGNESNHGEGLYPYGAEDYAEAVIAHVAAIRRVDPDVRIGINNGNSLSVDFVAFMDRLTAKGRANLFRKSVKERQRFLLSFDRSNREAAARRLNDGVTVSQPALWWPTVLNRLKAENVRVDVLVVHQYLNSNRDDSTKPLGWSQDFSRFQDEASRLYGRQLKISMSEYGVEADLKRRPGYGDLDYALDIMEIIGEALQAKVLDMQLFDLRFRAQSILENDDFEPTDAGRVVRFASASVGRQVLGLRNTYPGVFALATKSKRGDGLSHAKMTDRTVSLVLVNRLRTAQKVPLDFGERFDSVDHATTLRGKGGDFVTEDTRVLETDENAGTMKVVLPPRSITRVFVRTR